MNRKLLLLSSLLLLACSAATAQQSRYDGVVVGPKGPLANQYIAVCSQPANTSTTPCSPLITLYSSSTGASSTNPIQSDAFGNFHFYATQGIYTVQIYGPQVQTPFVLLDQIVGQILTSFNVVSNPQNITQDPLITTNYDNLFSYQSLDKTITNTSNEIGLANINQMSGTPGIHGAYGLYNVADYTALNGGFGWGIENDTYFKDTSPSNSNIIGAQLNSVTAVAGSTATLADITAYDGLVVNLGSDVMTLASGYIAAPNLNLGAGSITNSYGFTALNQQAVGTSTTAGYFAAAQTACGLCYGFLSASTNNDSFGNLAATSISTAGNVLGGTVTASTSSIAQRFKSNGTVLVAGDFALSGGWGTTATVSSINNNASDAAGDVTIASSGTGQAANPTVVLTFHNGTWTNAPICVAARADLSAPTPASAPWVRTALSATTITWTFNNTPVAGNSYVLTWVCIGH